MATGDDPVREAAREIADEFDLRNAIYPDHNGGVLTTNGRAVEALRAAYLRGVREGMEKAAHEFDDLEQQLVRMTKGPQSLNGGQYEHFVSHVIIPQIQRKAAAIRQKMKEGEA